MVPDYCWKVECRTWSSHKAVDGGLHRLPIVVHFSRVGDGKDRAILGSDSRFFRIIRIAYSSRMRCPAKRSRLEVQWRQIGTFNPGWRWDQWSIPTANSIYSVAEVFLSSFSITFYQGCWIFVLHVKVARDCQVFRWTELVKWRLHAFVMVVFSFIVRIGVSDKVSGASRSQGSPEDARVKRCSSIEGVGTARLSCAAFASTSSPAWQNYICIIDACDIATKRV